MGIYAEEHVGDEAAETEGSEESCGYSEECHFSGLRKNHERDAAGLRAEGHANADFLGALANDVGNHAVDAERGEDESKGCEHTEKGHGEPFLGERVSDDIGHGAGTVENELAVDGVNGLSNGFEGAGRGIGGANNDRRAAIDKREDRVGNLLEGEVSLGLRVLRGV